MKWKIYWNDNLVELPLTMLYMEAKRIKEIQMEMGKPNELEVKIWSEFPRKYWPPSPISEWEKRFAINSSRELWKSHYRSMTFLYEVIFKRREIIKWVTKINWKPSSVEIYIAEEIIEINLFHFNVESEINFIVKNF